jgi:prolyl oligopeptidase
MRIPHVFPAIALAGLAACGSSTPQPAPSPTPAPTPTAGKDGGNGAPVAGGGGATTADPYLWLEDVTGDRAMAWVKAKNAESEKELGAVPGFAALEQRLLAIYDSKDRIPFVGAYNKYLYNLWQDEANPRGLWRRTTLAEYKKAKPKWETVLDLDALGKAEGESWVWHGATCLFPKYERCLVSLSRGGADADVVREFDTKTKKFVEGGFALPEAKNDVGWKDLDTIYVGTDFGPGSLTNSGYPRIAKEWKRGTPLSEATTIFEGKVTDVSAGVYREHDHGKVRDWARRGTTFYTDETYLFAGKELKKIDKPDDANAGAWNDHMLITLRSAWTIGDKTWPAGALLVTPLADYLAGKRDFQMLFEPTPTTSLAGVAPTKSAILVSELDDVKSRIYLWKPSKTGWKRTKLDTPDVGSLGVWAYDSDLSDDFWYSETGYTTPSSVWLGNINKKARTRLKSNPAFFDAKGIVATQHFATSKDGTRVPYFQVARADLPLDGSNPTILYGYGGFEQSMTPSYSATFGVAWLERGGVYVVANIRGGGEYGPTWHQAALKHDRQRAYDDFIAVGEDLIGRKVTSTPKLGAMGGSNGGLLVGVMLTERPDLWGAIVCEQPLLDMKRFHKLLAGASWMAEYGDPDDAADWAAIAKYSPYHNVKAGVTYPRTLFTTSTRDDRVHPGHARKLAAKLDELKQSFLFYENIEGGHAGAADNKQQAHMTALEFSFFANQLGLAPPADGPAPGAAPTTTSKSAAP